MRVAVTGATGHVGSNLVRALQQRGDQVRVLIRDRADALAGLEVERVRGSVGDAEALQRLFAGVDVVYHLAAMISISGDPHGHVRATNVDGTRRVATAALAAGVRRMVHCSSVHAFDLYVPGGEGEQRVDESWPRVPDAAPHFAYDRSKAAGERALHEVIAAGLDMDFQGRPFGPMPQLMAISEFTTKVHAICMHCGELATFSHRTTKSQELVLLGETESYVPLCRGCFNAARAVPTGNP